MTSNKLLKKRVPPNTSRNYVLKSCGFHDNGSVIVKTGNYILHFVKYNYILRQLSICDLKALEPSWAHLVSLQTHFAKI